MPSRNSSSNSLAKFSLGLPFVFSLASSQTSMAGSLATAWARASKLPAPWARKISFCRYISSGSFTFWIDVAKWSCQNRVSRSRSGVVDSTMRSIHHWLSLRPSSRLARWSACWAARRAASSPGGATTAGGVNVGTGTAAPSATLKSTSRSTVAS